MIQKVVTLFLLAILFSFCAGTPYYSYNYPLTSELVNSSDNSLNSLLPSGWFASNDNSHTKIFLFWLIKDDYSGSITLQEIHVDNSTRGRITKEGLKLLGEISNGFKKESADDYYLSKEPELFIMNGKQYCGYEYYADNTSKRVRVVLFQIGEKFYECSAIPLTGVWFDKDLREMYNAMHAFINSFGKNSLL
ncbi:MAG: hypothetical protein Q8K98_07655 [Bacteroidota bacterium]|nr:hypothetical protein [Bacteroidota bacterium]